MTDASDQSSQPISVPIGGGQVVRMPAGPGGGDPLVGEYLEHNRATCAVVVLSWTWLLVGLLATMLGGLLGDYLAGPSPALPDDLRPGSLVAILIDLIGHRDETLMGMAAGALSASLLGRWLPLIGLKPEGRSPGILRRRQIPAAHEPLIAAPVLMLAYLLTIDAWLGPSILTAFIAVVYLVPIVFRLLALLLAGRSRGHRIDPTKEAEPADGWPVYTILVPLYRETAVADKILRNLGELDYPHDKLDVKFLLEADDEETLEALTTAGVPDWAEVLVVPDAQPKTKPRACNHGLERARGEYLVIYDAEDRPEPDQLKKVVLAYRKLQNRQPVRSRAIALIAGLAVAGVSSGLALVGMFSSWWAALGLGAAGVLLGRARCRWLALAAGAAIAGVIIVGVASEQMVSNPSAWGWLAAALALVCGGWPVRDRGADAVACIQAHLAYYNHKQNLLTRWFALEYNTWFMRYLPGLVRLGGPIPLGGTSNHFRTEVLHQVHGWDPFNVTEDCDLGIRLAVSGYRTEIVDSVTWEEANSRVGNWVRQRSRWMKGYLVTHFVWMRRPFGLLMQLGPLGMLRFLAAVFGVAGLAVLNAVLWLAFGYYLALVGIDLANGHDLWTILASNDSEQVRSAWRMWFAGPDQDPFWAATSQVLFGISLLLLTANLLFIVVHLFGGARRGQFWSLWLAALLMPLYWVLITIGALKGLWQMLTKPHYWEKTVHGLDHDSSTDA